ncbi:hypothetical protein MTO96_012186 [Rhipicephalus appendiculatus]
MRELLSGAAHKEELKEAECLVLILMSHGDKDGILGVDNQWLPLKEDVYAQFNNENCPALQGKPKLFFIQACRGSDCDYGTDATVDDMLESSAAPSSSGQQDVNPWSDMYIAHATIPGYKSRRSKARGSWFLSTVFEVFSKHAGTMHLDDLMERVSTEIMKKEGAGGRKQTPTVELWGWSKKLYFNPKKFVDAWPAELC